MLFFLSSYAPPSSIFRPVKGNKSSTIYYWPSRVCGNFYFQFKRALPVNEKFPKKYVIKLQSKNP